VESFVTKAFDCVNHDVLTVKLEHYGIQESTLNWFKYYLSNRRQRTKLITNKDQIYYCTWEIVKQGVPQGSELACYFLLYILKIYQCVSNMFLKLYCLQMIQVS